MDKKKIYLSYPITGYDIKERRQTVGRLKAWLNAYIPEWDIIDPLVIYDNHVAELGNTEASWEDAMRWDMAELAKCDHILLLEGWDKSAGCEIEYKYANNNGITRVELICEGDKSWPKLIDVKVWKD